MKPSCRARAPGRCTRSASCWWRVILGSLSEGRSGWYYPRGEGDGVERDAGASPAQRPVIETRGCSSPTSIRSRQPSKSGAAGTRACAGRRDARGTARPSSCGRLTLAPGRFAKSNCARGTAISLSRARAPAALRFLIVGSNSAGKLARKKGLAELRVDCDYTLEPSSAFLSTSFMIAECSSNTLARISSLLTHTVD